MKHSHQLVRSVLLACGLAVATPLAAEDIAPMPAEIAPRAVESLLTAVATAGDQRLVAVGSRGHILLSDDAGARWRQVASPVNSLLTEVTFIDAKTGWAVGHDAVVLKTTDGGETWALKNFQPQNEALLDVMFFDADRGLILGAYGVLLKSTDGGETWEALENELTEEGMHLNAITRLNDGRLLIVGEAGLVATSSDGGRSWQREASPYEGSLFSARPYGERGAIIGGLRGNSFRSEDVAAVAWTAVRTGSEQSVFGIDALGDGHVLAGLNASIVMVHADGSVTTPALLAVDNGERDAPGAAVMRDDAAFAGILVLDSRHMITVGDSGVRRWRLH